MKKLRIFTLTVLFSILFWNCKQQTKINILLIVADDLAYTDISAYGGEIHTPNLDTLSNNGIRFSQFHTAPYCAVTRAMVLTGNNNHIAGMGSQDLRTKVPGYEGQLSNRVVTIPQLLQKEGYRTFIAGKWHLGTSNEANPQNKGFNQSFVMLEGAANHYNSVGVLREPKISPYTEDGQPALWPKDAYSTDYYTDRLLDYIVEANENNQPFFGFAAYTSPHWPLQVDEKHWKKFKGHYSGGYDSLRSERHKRAQEVKLISQLSSIPDRHPEVVPWDQLTKEDQRIEARKMELYAGMVDNLDYNIGRLISKLKALDIYDNTLIIFMSDNGAAAEDFVNHDYFGPYIKKHFNNVYDNMGKANSYVSYGKPWAEAGSAPFKYFKGYTTEGGMTAPLIISGPMIRSKNEFNHSFISLMDLAPTIYELIDIDYPSQFSNNKVSPLLGASLVPIFSEPQRIIHDDSYVFALEHRGFAMLRKGEWKLLNINSPLDPSSFKLYNLKSDPGEQIDLKYEHTRVYENLMQEWHKFYQQVGIVSPTPETTER